MVQQNGNSDKYAKIRGNPILGGQNLTYSSSVKYLAVILDYKLS